MKVNREEMIAHVERQRAAGVSIAAYAREHGLPYHRLKYWSHRVPVSHGSAGDAEAFVLLSSRSPGPGAAGVRVQIQGSEAAVLFPADCAPAYVAAVCRAVLPC